MHARPPRSGFQELLAGVAEQSVTGGHQKDAHMTTAHTQYQAHQARIQSLTQQLQAKLASHSTKAAARPQDWGYAGDLGHVEARLQELVEFF